MRTTIRARDETAGEGSGADVSERATIYVHVPFCVVKCGYCDFNSYVVEDRAAHDRFLVALDEELRAARPDRDPPSVFIGGGTPTYLDDERFRRLLEIVGRHVDLAACPEVTVEGNPESCSETKFRIARELGVNRISLGVQSFDRDALRFLDRAHSREHVDRAVDAARSAGIGNLSLDLIYGLPDPFAEVWASDLEQALALGPDHLSCYQLTYEPGTRLTHALDRGEVAPLDQDRESELFQWTHERLAGAGFEAYEVSNFAGPGGRCRHNLHYWAQGNYLGVGPGAASHHSGWRTTNLKPLHAWCSAIERGLPAVGEGELLNRARRLGEALWLGLRTKDGVHLDRMEQRFGSVAVRTIEPTLHRFLVDGLLARDDHRISLTPNGWPLADSISEAFLV